MGKVERRVLAAVLAGAVGALTVAGCGGGVGGIGSRSFSDGEPVDQQVGKVRFDVPAGAVRIRVEDGAPVSLRRTVRHTGDRPGKTHRVEGDTLMLQGCGQECEVEYDVVLPRNLPVSGSVDAGGLEINGAAGADVRTSAGPAVLRGITGPAKIDAGAGKIDLVMAVPADVRAVAATGSVTVTVPRGAYQVDAGTDAGKTDVQVPADPAAEHRIEARSSAGSVTVRFG